MNYFPEEKVVSIEEAAEKKEETATFHSRQILPVP